MEVGKSRMEVVAGPILGEDPLPGLQTAASHCSLTWQREEGLVSFLLYLRALIPLWGLHTPDLI